MPSSSNRIGALVADADRRTARKNLDNRPTFSSVKSALSFFWEWRERLQAPQGLSPRTIVDAEGETHLAPSVDGGRGSSLESIMTTVSTIGKNLRDLEVRDPVGHGLLVSYHRDGKTQDDLAKVSKMAQSTVWARLTKAEAFLTGAMVEAEVLR